MANSTDRSPVDDTSLDPDKEARMLLNPPTDSVQFTSNTPRDPTNGQVLLSPVGSGPNAAGRSGVGMTKQELMKYANDPFWVRLRTFLFILFWVVWFAMLIGSVVIVAMAPRCPTTASLPWWKKLSMTQMNIEIPNKTDRKSYASQLKEKINEVEDSLPHLKDMHVSTVILNSLDPYIFATVPNDNNDTKEEIDRARSALTSLAKNVDDIKMIVHLSLPETSRSFFAFKESVRNHSDYKDFYIWSPDIVKNTTSSWEYDPDRFAFVALSDKNEPLLNFASPKVKELVRETVLAWMKTKIGGIQTESIWSQDPETGKISKSAEAEQALLQAVKAAGQGKVLIITDQMRGENAFEDDPLETSDLAPEPQLWKKLVDNLPNLKRTLEEIFQQYSSHEHKALTEGNKTEDNLVTRENVGHHWKTYQIPHPADKSNPIAKEFGVPLAEAVTMAIYMIPRVTPIVQLNLTAEGLKTLKADSPVIPAMNEIRAKNPETFLVGRTILPKVQGSDQVFAVYRGAKNEHGYLLLINFGKTEATVSVDTSLFPFQDDIIVKKVALGNKEYPKDYVGTELDLDKIKLGPKQALLAEFQTK